MTSSRARVFCITDPTRYEIEAPLGDHITKQISKGVAYEAGLLKAVARVVGEGTFIDVGAHIGNHTLYFANLGWTGMSFEANPDIFGFLDRNIARNGLQDSVTAFCLALGGEDCLADVVDERRGNTGARRLGVCPGGAVTVVPFDRFGASPDVVKIDVGGMELDVLRGMRETIARSLPAIVIEAHDGLADVVRTLRPLGYRRIGGSWAASPTYIFVARPSHKVRSLRLVGTGLQNWLRYGLRLERFAGPRRAYGLLKRVPRLLVQRLTARMKIVVRFTRGNVDRISLPVEGRVSVQSVGSNMVPTIVSMTSFPARISSAWVAIESCFDQSHPADGVILCLSREEFPNGRLPKSINRYVKFGLKIVWVNDNTRSYKKLVPARMQNPYAAIITVDDDAIYTRDCFAELIDLSHSSPLAVIGHRGHEVAWDSSGPAPYTTWLSADMHTPSQDVFLTGVGGILYPPSLPSEKLLCDVTLATRLCPTSDDIWFWAANRAFGVQQICTGRRAVTSVLQVLPAPNLWEVNVSCGQNDRQLEATVDYFKSKP